MRWSYNLERSYAAAIWLATVAVLVFCMVVVGGATRLTGSGLSITEWRPISGVIPPLSSAGWIQEFDKYQKIPQFQLVNRDLTISAFKSLYWWEWGHRLLGRLVGVAVLFPFLILLLLRRIPRRLIWRCGIILGLVALEGLAGWWMVASGLAHRISVAPERLALHLFIAVLTFSVCIWTCLEAWFGRPRSSFGSEYSSSAGSFGLVALAIFQMVLGALVAGNKAGQIDNDWPTMGGKIIPVDYAPKGEGLWQILVHNQASVQFDHRIGAYVLLAAALAFAISIWRSGRAPVSVGRLSLIFLAVVAVQGVLGVITLHFEAPLALGLAHQSGAVIVLATAVVLAWRVQRN